MATTWDATSVIIIKRDGGKLPADAIAWFIDGYTRGAVADEQAAALCMAVYLNGLDNDELAAWTEAMIDSGSRVDLGTVERPTVDKHSTGGVGDKISLILCPLMAACGAAMPQVSGRGLGHTGGTLDKMASIPGWRAELSTAELRRAMTEVGAVISAASEDLAPADRKLYALRDVTGTVASIPLIASSIMSKKIASGTSALVLDVKVGRGAFMTNLDDARVLAETMVGIGREAGVATVALLTRMDQPLGRMVGNTLEVDESLDVLDGGGPLDVRRVTLALAEEMLALAGLSVDPAAVLDRGSGHDAFVEMVRFQGGDLDAQRPTARFQQPIDSPATGWVTDLDALAVGQAAVRLGAGRARKEDEISYGAGIECAAKPGDPVTAGEPVFVIHADDEARFPPVIERLAGAITIGPEPVEQPDVVIERIG
ncbi:MAG: thymidine phosphorylase [Acidimicrobiia bacterium]|nr:thymidine phosphorylase [Acidimicrobiia bacterium]